MRQVFIFTFALGLFLNSCVFSKKEQTVLSLRSVDLDSLTSQRVDTFLIIEQSFIPLETNAEVLISKINEIRKIGDRYYVLDEKLRSVFIFDKNGKYISKIANSGKGPGQYFIINDFFIRNNQIFILDGRGHIYVYSEQGDFIQYINLQFQARYCEYIGDGNVVFQNIRIEGVVKYSVGIYNLSSGKFIHAKDVIVGVEDDNYNFMLVKHLWRSPGGVYYNNDYSNIVYKISSNKGIEPAFKFTSKFFPTTEDIALYNKDPEQRQNSRTEISYLKCIFECNNYIIFSFYSQYGPFQVAYLKDQKRYVCGETKLQKYFELSSAGEFLSIRVPAYIPKKELQEIEKKLISSTDNNSITVNNNPIITISSIKNF